MAGHSKWANIKHRKGAADAQRARQFTKFVKEIMVAAKLNGPDPQANPRLRMAIQNAKGVSMPKDNIERAIKKASGVDADNYAEVTYEGYAPHGVAIFVECTTDNINRTVQNVRSYFNKCGGSLGTNGSLQFIFEHKGIFLIPAANLDEETLTLELIDAGAEDFESAEGYFHVSCPLEQFGAVQKKLEELQIDPENAALQRIPNTWVKLGDEDLKKVIKLIDLLEEDDDVQKVYHNLEISDAQMALI